MWWGDYQSAYPYEMLSMVMDRGKFGLLGCHPAQMLGTFYGPGIPELAYARIDSVLTSLENDYPHFLWLFPAEYGDFLEDLYSIRVDHMTGEAPLLSMDFTGAVPEGLTLCAQLHPDDVITYVLLDGIPIPWEKRSGGRLFAHAPALPFASHSFRIGIQAMGIEENPAESGFGVFPVSPVGGPQLTVLVPGLEEGMPVSVSVFDLSGRSVLIRSDEVVSSELILELDGSIPSGVYMVTVRSGGRYGTGRFTVLR